MRAKAGAHTLKGVAGTLSAQALESALRRGATSFDGEVAALVTAHARVMTALAGLPREAAAAHAGGSPRARFASTLSTGS